MAQNVHNFFVSVSVGFWMWLRWVVLSQGILHGYSYDVSRSSKSKDGSLTWLFAGDHSSLLTIGQWPQILLCGPLHRQFMYP